MNRLQDSSYDGRKESFTYDKVGNRLTKTTNDITEKYVYNVKNQLKEVYREKGNSTQVPSLSKFDLAKYKIWSLTYDAFCNVLDSREDIHKDRKGNSSGKLRSTSHLAKYKIWNGIAYRAAV